jgi:hypothetical protein
MNQVEIVESLADDFAQPPDSTVNQILHSLTVPNIDDSKIAPIIQALVAPNVPVKDEIMVEEPPTEAVVPAAIETVEPVASPSRSISMELDTATVSDEPEKDIFPPFPTPQDESYPLFDETDDHALPPEEIYILAESDQEIELEQSMFYKTISAKDAKVELTILEKPSVMLVDQKPDPILEALQNALDELRSSDNAVKYPVISNEELSRVMERRLTTVGLPTMTRIANTESQTIINDIMVVLLPSLYGTFGVDQLPKQNLKSTDDMLGLTEEKEKEKKKPKAKPKAPAVAAPPSAPSLVAPSSAPTPKLTLKLNNSAPLVPVENSEKVNCICEEPEKDDGMLMIACDICNRWFHGKCVGVALVVSEWKCTAHEVAVVDQNLLAEQQEQEMDTVEEGGSIDQQSLDGTMQIDQ